MSQHYINSSYREKLLEHIFVGELLKHSWLERKCGLEVAKPEVDNSGYDLIAEERGIVRHIQLKASHSAARTANQKVHIALSEKPSGCIIWIHFSEETLDLGPFLFFGGLPGCPLPDLSAMKTAKHTKANAEGVKAERPSIRTVPKGSFHRVECIREIYELLFGSGA